MIPAVVVFCLLLAHTGHSAPTGPDCSRAVSCYSKLRTQILLKISALPGPGENEEDSLFEYKKFCTVHFPLPSPCVRSFKDCSAQPDVQQRETLFEQLRDFVCGGDEKDFKRFQAVLHTDVNDPCKGAIKATDEVLKGDTSKCGSVEKLFGECASQQRLPTDVLEPGMKLLGCKDLPPELPPSPPPAVKPLPGEAQPHAEPECRIDEVRQCLQKHTVHLSAGFGLQPGQEMSEEDACTPPAEMCLNPAWLQGCPDNETLGLPVYQAAVDAMRQTACANDRAVLKGIRQAAPCWDTDKFLECSHDVHIEAGNAPSKEQCDSATSSINQCLKTSGKPCFQAADIENAKKLSAAFLEPFGCYSKDSGEEKAKEEATGKPTEEPKEKPKEKPTEAPKGKPKKEDGKSSGSGLACSFTLTAAVALAAAIALRH